MNKAANLFFILHLFASSVCFALGKGDTLSASQQTAQFVGRTLEISDIGQILRIPNVSDLPDKVPAAPVVRSVTKRSGGYYVVVTTSEWSRGYPPKSGMCGSGSESFIKWFHVVEGNIRESQLGLYESCFDNRVGRGASWNGSLFTVTTDDLLEDNLHAKKMDEIWQTITYSFDFNHPEDGIKEDKSVARAFGFSIPLRTRVSRSDNIFLGRAMSLSVVDEHSGTVFPEPWATETRYSLRLTIKPITVFRTLLKEAPPEFILTYGKGYYFIIEEERARLVGKDRIYFLSGTSNESSFPSSDFSVPPHLENDVRKEINESK